MLLGLTCFFKTVTYIGDHLSTGDNPANIFPGTVPPPELHLQNQGNRLEENSGKSPTNDILGSGIGGQGGGGVELKWL